VLVLFIGDRVDIGVSVKRDANKMRARSAVARLVPSASGNRRGGNQAGRAAWRAPALSLGV
jgi:hypothetical protein